MTLEELHAEVLHWDSVIAGATGWGGSLAAADEFRRDAEREIRKRERTEKVPVHAIGDKIDAALETAVEDAIRPVRRFPVYVASTISHAGMWKDLRRKWKAANIDIVSTWIDKIDPVHGDSKVSPLRFAGEWIENYREVSVAKAVVCFVEERDNLRGALIETGIAMGQHKPVIIVGPMEHKSWGSWQYHPLVTYAASLTFAKNVIETWMGRERTS